MSYVITKTVDGRFTYWWGWNNKWQGLKDNARKMQSKTEVEEQIRTIRNLGLYEIE